MGRGGGGGDGGTEKPNSETTQHHQQSNRQFFDEAVVLLVLTTANIFINLQHARFVVISFGLHRNVILYTVHVMENNKEKKRRKQRRLFMCTIVCVPAVWYHVMQSTNQLPYVQNKINKTVSKKIQINT